MEYLGSIYQDEKLSRAVSDQVPAVVRYPTSDISRCYRIIASTLLGQGAAEVDHERFWTRLITMILKSPKPRTAKSPSPADVQKNGDLRGMIRDLLDEQRRTRILLERLVEKIERQESGIRPKTGPST